MSVTLASLVSQLQSEIPAVNSVPTTTQYTQAIKDAVHEFSRRCGVVKVSELEIVTNTAAYALPDDFLSLVMLESPAGSDGVILSDAGIIPIEADWDETHQIQNRTIIFFPTPAYTMTREFRYKAAWILTGSSGSETYANMTTEEAQIVMIKAKGLALEKIANSTAGSGNQKYSLGAVSVDKSSGGGSLSAQVYKLHGLFVEECAAYNGTYGSFA